MNTARSITSRNILGSFCGGFMGILAAGLVHTLLIPAGVIAGVLGGFYHQEIVEIIRAAWRRRVRRTRAYIRLYSRMPRTFRSFVRERWPNWVPVKGLVLFGSWFVSNFFYLRWFRAHPMNRAYLVRTGVVLVYCAVNAVAFWFILSPIPSLEWALSPDGPAGGLLGMLGVLFLFCLGITALSSIPQSFEGSQNELKRMGQFYRELGLYTSKGKLAFFLRDMKAMFQCEFWMLLKVGSLLSYLLVVGALYITLALTPVLVAFGALRGVYRLSMREDHWLCMITTLVVTFVSAMMMSSFLATPLALWLTAFTTGAASGLATEGLRRLLARFFEASEVVASAATSPIGSHLGWANSLFRQGAEAAIDSWDSRFPLSS